MLSNGIMTLPSHLISKPGVNPLQSEIVNILIFKSVRHKKPMRMFDFQSPQKKCHGPHVQTNP